MSTELKTCPFSSSRSSDDKLLAGSLTYVLITPARNEATFIEQTIKSVVAQTVLPAKWVIVSDGSTDRTDDIVRQYVREHEWIELLRMPERTERNFAAKVHAFNAGYERVRHLKADVIGSLDADITFEEDYFRFLLSRLASDPMLGLVGTPFKEESRRPYDYRFTNIEHVSGGCQLFRRKCFEDVGGYSPVKEGCIDHIAVLTARLKGWKTKTFTEKVCLHHRAMGTAQRGRLMAKFRTGEKDYAIGNHPVWEVLRAAYQMTRRPFLVGGLMVFSGYAWSAVRSAGRPVAPELLAFQRREQMLRLKRLLTGR
jgi:poly-beta-1,6-N-acetyl-D-glucosamine synthase